MFEAGDVGDGTENLLNSEGGSFQSRGTVWDMDRLENEISSDQGSINTRIAG